jgi:hypothetical protein
MQHSSKTNMFNMIFLSQYQSQKELVVNENFNKIDLLLNRGVKSYQTTIPSENIDPGSLYIVPANAEGEMAKYQNHLALFTDSFEYIQPTDGMLFWCQDDKSLIVYSNKSWEKVSVLR